MYNGPSYWQNRYDIKLAEQFQRFASGSLPNLEMRTAQVALLFLGYAPGKINGMIGPRTRAAIKNFRVTAGLSAGEELDGPTYQALCKKSHDPSITPFKKLSKKTPQAMPSTKARFSAAERYDEPRSSELSDLTRRFKMVDAALDDLIQILCCYLISNGQRFGTQPGKLVVDQAKS